MPPFNPLVASRYADLLRRVMGEDLSLESVAPEIMPVMELGVIDRAEWLFSQGVRLWTTGPVQIAAAVGNRGRIEIPNLSDHLVIVVTAARVLNVPAVAQQYLLTMDGPAAGTPAQNFARDSRVKGLTVTSVNRISNAAGGVGGNFLDELNTPAADAGRDFNFNALPVVIHPGHNLQLWDNIVNTLLRAQLWGYEYDAITQELAP